MEKSERLIKSILEFIKPSSGSDSGDGYGYGYGDGSGNGLGDGSGNGYGDGSGNGYGEGSGKGSGSGEGFGYGRSLVQYGNGAVWMAMGASGGSKAWLWMGSILASMARSGKGFGNGAGSGNGAGYDYGYGSGDSSGSGKGFGLGSGYGDCYGNGYGNGYGDGDGFGFGFDSNKKSGIVQINNMYVFKIDGLPTIITKVRGNIAKGFLLDDDLTLTPCFIAKQNNLFAHGVTLRAAINSLQVKLFGKTPVNERIDLFMKKFKLGKKYKGTLFFDWHEYLTGSCLEGRKHFIRNNNLSLDNEYTVEEFIKLTENSYGKEIIKILKKAYGIIKE